MKASLPAIRLFRLDLKKKAMEARKRHRGQATAHRLLLKTTTVLLKAEMNQRQKAKPVAATNDLFSEG